MANTYTSLNDYWKEIEMILNLDNIDCVKTSYVSNAYGPISFKTKEGESIEDAKKRLAKICDDLSYTPRKQKVMRIEDILNLLNKLGYNCFLTGSKVFGLDTEKSDFDICVIKNEVDFVNIKNVMTSNYGPSVDSKSDYNDGVKLHFIEPSFKEINFIPLSLHDWIYWHMTTTIVKDLCVTNPSTMKNKSMRVGMFETVNGLVRMILGNEINDGSAKKYVDRLNSLKSKEINDILHSRKKGKDVTTVLNFISSDVRKSINLTPKQICELNASEYE